MSTNTALQPTYKPTNRAIQQLHETYTSKSDLSEAYHIARTNKIVNLSEPTLKLIKHFTYTEGGATQAGIGALCKLIGISLGTFYNTVKPEIESFDEPLILFNVKAPKKKDKLGRKNKSTPYKVLQSLQKIKMLFEKKEKEILAAYEESRLESRLESRQEPLNPCESKDEASSLEEQRNTIREIPLEKDLNNKSNYKNENKQPSKKYKIKKEIKTFLNKNTFFNCFDEIKRHRVAEKIQFAFIKTGADFNDIGAQEAALEALRSFVVTCEKQPDNIKKDYYGALYFYVQKALNDYLKEQQQEQEMDAQEATGEPQNVFERYYNQEDETTPQGQRMTKKEYIEFYGTREEQDELLFGPMIKEPIKIKQHNERDISQIDWSTFPKHLRF